MEEIQYIKGLENYEGLSLREISRKTGRNFDTVKKYVECENWNITIKPTRNKPSKLDPLKPIINKWLIDDLKMPSQLLIGTNI